MVFSSYEIMTFWYSKIHIRCLNTHLIEIMNEVATVLEVEVAWAMVLPSYEMEYNLTTILQEHTARICMEYSSKEQIYSRVLEHTFNWNY